MQIRSRKMLATVGTVGALAAVGAGTAVATSGTGESAPPDRAAVLSDVAEKLGVTEQALEDAFGAVAEERGMPERGERDGHGHHGGPQLDTAAEYLGLSADELRSQLEAGKTLAEIAVAQGKTADGLVDALLADARDRIEAFVNGEFPADGPPAPPATTG